MKLKDFKEFVSEQTEKTEKVDYVHKWRYARCQLGKWFRICTCHKRTCYSCMKMRKWKMRKRVISAMMWLCEKDGYNPNKEFTHIVLTYQNVSATELNKAWYEKHRNDPRMLRQALKRKYHIKFDFGLEAMENKPHSKGDIKWKKVSGQKYGVYSRDEYHPHYHLLVYGDANMELRKHLIKKEWKKITGADIVDIKMIWDNPRAGVYYVSKYIVKTMPDDDVLTQQWLDVVQNKRLYQTFGIRWQEVTKERSWKYKGDHLCYCDMTTRHGFAKDALGRIWRPGNELKQEYDDYKMIMDYDPLKSFLYNRMVGNIHYKDKGKQSHLDTCSVSHVEQVKVGLDASIDV